MSDSLRVPKYRRHKPSGQAVVTLGGKDCYLGRWRTKASRTEYQRLVGEWLANGCCLPPDDAEVSVAQLALAYWGHAKVYYRRDGRPTGSIDRVRVALRILRESYAATPVNRFGPLALKAIQGRLEASGNTRRYVNYLVDTIRRVFRWGVAQELVPESIYRALTAVSGLRKGRSSAREPEPIRPVDDQIVDGTLPYLPEVLADMVRLQRLTGCRPGEVCIVRPCDVDTSGEVWLYRPESHKTQYHGRERVICIGPKGQDVLRQYLLRPADCYCFVPAESEKKRRAFRHAQRTTPLSYGNRPGTNRKRRPKREPGDCYTTSSYRQAIHRALVLANRDRDRDNELPKWGPNRLRHSAATGIRKQFGLEAAQVTLGHATADVTQVYAERDLELATKIMRKIG